MITDGAHLLSQDGAAPVTATNLLERLDLERLDISNRLAIDPKRRADLGQFFTPASVAAFMASMLKAPNPPKELRILDPGGGSGVLMSAAVAEICARPRHMLPAVLHATVWEIDEADRSLALGLARLVAVGLDSDRWTVGWRLGHFWPPYCGTSAVLPRSPNLAWMTPAQASKHSRF